MTLILIAGIVIGAFFGSLITWGIVSSRYESQISQSVIKETGQLLGGGD